MNNCLISRISTIFSFVFIAVFSAQFVAAEPSEESPRKWFSSEIGDLPEKLSTPGENVLLSSSTHQSRVGRLIDNTESTSSNKVLDDRIYFAQAAQKKASAEPQEAGGMSLEEVARAMDNPLGSLWLLIMQNDLSRFESDLVDDDEWFNSFKIMPVLPMRLTKNWNLINRPILQIQSSPLDSDVGDLFGVSPTEITANPGLTAIAQDPIGRTTGVGDMIMFNMISPAKTDGGFIWGVGPTFIFPTASHDVLGQGKW